MPRLFHYDLLKLAPSQSKCFSALEHVTCLKELLWQTSPSAGVGLGFWNKNLVTFGHVNHLHKFQSQHNHKNKKCLFQFGAPQQKNNNLCRIELSFAIFFFRPLYNSMLPFLLTLGTIKHSIVQQFPFHTGFHLQFFPC